MTIGEVAQKTGVGVETIRYYERAGIIAQPKKISDQYREYPKEAVQQIRFIKHAQELDFTLAEITEFLALLARRETFPPALRKKVARKLLQVEEKIAELLRVREALCAIASCCESQKDNQGCPVLDRFFAAETVKPRDFLAEVKSWLGDVRE